MFQATKFAIIAVLALFVQSAFALKHTRTSIVDTQHIWTPQDQEAEVFFGRNLASKMLGEYSLYHDDVAHGYLNHLGSALARYSSRPDLDFYFAILDSDNINAFAAPGGYIFITKGALMQCQDESELVGILGHEIGHVTERHIVKQLNIRGKKADDFTSFMSTVISGGGQSATSAFKIAMDEALDIWHGKGLKSREDEYEADLIATKILTRAGYPVDGFVRLLDRISYLKAETADQVRTHPPFASRINRIKQAAKLWDQPYSVGDARFSGYLSGLHQAKKERDLVLKELSLAPLVPDADYQAYLAKIAHAVSLTTSIEPFSLAAVASKEKFYKKFGRYSLVSTGLLEQVDNEAQMTALVLHQGFLEQYGSEVPYQELDTKIAVGLMGLGYKPWAWKTFVEKVPGKWQRGLETRMKYFVRQFSDNEEGEVRKARWLSKRQTMQQVKSQQDIHPLLAWSVLEKDVDVNKHYNLMAYALTQVLKGHDINVGLKRVMVLDDQFHYARMQQGTLVVSKLMDFLLKDEGLAASMMLNAMLLDHYLTENKKLTSSEVYSMADAKTSEVLAEMGYSRFALMDLMVSNHDNQEMVRSETFEHRIESLALAMNINIPEIDETGKVESNALTIDDPAQYFSVDEQISTTTVDQIYKGAKVDMPSWITDLDVR